MFFCYWNLQNSLSKWQPLGTYARKFLITSTVWSWKPFTHKCKRKWESLFPVSSLELRDNCKEYQKGCIMKLSGCWWGILFPDDETSQNQGRVISLSQKDNKCDFFWTIKTCSVSLVRLMHIKFARGYLANWQNA